MIELIVVAMIVAGAGLYSWKKLVPARKPSNPCGCDHADNCELVQFLGEKGKDKKGKNCGRDYKN